MPQGVCQSRLVIALDNLSRPMMLEMAEMLQGKVWGFKVNDALDRYGVQIVKDLKMYGNVFADPKCHDIPNTVANRVSRYVEAGADLITCHASGGLEMLRAAVRAGGDRILAVTVLTSMSVHDILDVYSDSRIEGIAREDLVDNLASIARSAGCWGIVCAPGDLPHVPPMRTVVPGFRPNGLVAGDDQKNVGGFEEVKSATLIVVGRPVTAVVDPLAVVAEYNRMLS